MTGIAVQLVELFRNNFNSYCRTMSTNEELNGAMGGCRIHIAMCLRVLCDAIVSQAKGLWLEQVVEPSIDFSAGL